MGEAETVVEYRRSLTELDGRIGQMKGQLEQLKGQADEVATKLKELGIEPDGAADVVADLLKEQHEEEQKFQERLRELEEMVGANA